jgi:hypothetical protein
MDLILLYLMPVFAAIITIYFRFPSIIAYNLFLLIPSIYLSFKCPNKIKKILIYSLFFAIPVTFALEYIMQSLNVWQVTTVFNFYFFGIIPIEILIWGFLYSYLTIIYYEYFIDRDKEKKKFIFNNKTISIFTLLWLIITLIVPIILFLCGIIIPYMYLVFGILVIIFPIVFFQMYHPKFIKKLSKTITYNFTVAIFFEITEVYLKDWIWPGKYVGWVDISFVKFPIEELIFYMFLCSVGYLIYYEIFADDLK